MPFVSSRNLHERITMGNSSHPILSWMTQLSSAVTALETLGLAHRDIKPANILIDENDQLTLIDLDHALPFGSDLDVGDDPYVRAHFVGEIEGGVGGGVYDRAGPKTEPFVLGSIFWYMARG
jgi:serine/threonine protein kinase